MRCDRMVRCVLVGILTLTGLSVLPERASEASPDVDKSAISVRVDTNLVQIPVTVTDKNDQSVINLSKDNFTVYEDGVQQAIAHFETGESPISACLVFDSSASMADKIHRSLEALSEVLDTAVAGDEYCLIRFSNSPVTMVGMTEGTTQVASALTRIHPAGFTALLDAIYSATQEVRRGHNRRKAIVLISDGGDNRSEHTIHQIVRLVREADAQIYSIGILSPEEQIFSQEEVNGPALMKTISHDSGGRLFRIHQIGDLPSAVAKVNAALRHQYLLGYYPKRARSDGKYRHITVKLDLPRGTPHARAYWRAGYYPPLE
jgi:Ca-activated chloride channel family protein